MTWTRTATLGDLIQRLSLVNQFMLKSEVYFIKKYKKQPN